MKNKGRTFLIVVSCVVISSPMNIVHAYNEVIEDNEEVGETVEQEELDIELKEELYNENQEIVEEDKKHLDNNGKNTEKKSLKIQRYEWGDNGKHVIKLKKQ